MKRVLITGATGFVGANLARRLLREGHEVHALVRPGYRPWRIRDIRADLRIRRADLGDARQIERVVNRIRPEWVFHLSAYGAYSSQEDPRRMAETNLIAAANLMEACARAGFEAFLQAGSSSEYGFKDHAPREDEALEPNSAYAVTKAAATHYGRHLARSRNAGLATLRLYSVFGPYEEPTRLIPTLIVEGLRGGLPPLVNPEIARDYVYVDDVVEAFLLAAARPGVIAGKVYNVGSGTQTTLRQVVDLARRVLPVSAEPQWGTMPDRRWDTSVWVADHGLITRELGWQPAVSFEEGFRRTVGWLRSDPAMLRYYQAHRETPK